MNEATTIIRYVIPYLQELGWTIWDMELKRGGSDIVLRMRNEQITIIEAKAFGLLSKTENAVFKHGVAQLSRYLKEAGLSTGFLTDGKSWFQISNDDKALKIEPDVILRKSNLLQKIKAPAQSKTHSVTIEDYRADGTRAEIKVIGVPKGHILTKDEISGYLQV